MAPAAAIGPETSAYRVSLREMRFVLWEYLRVHETVLGRAPFDHLTRAQVEQLLVAAGDFACERLGTAYRASDLEGCIFDAVKGSVRVPSAYRALWDEYRNLWSPLLGARSNASSNAAMPHVVIQTLLEMFMGANPAFMTYSGFCVPAAKLLHRFGTETQKRLFLQKFRTFEWSACFCMTEREAGSDVSAIRSIGRKQPDGMYLIEGEKRFISAGMHDLTDNTIYFVVARTANSPTGSFGLTCFLVPKYWVGEDGEIGAPNDIRCVELPDKMGLRGCANTHLRFGENGRCRAFALGDRENVGVVQLLPLMSDARISTGIFGLGMASSAYLHSVDYAARRIQGRPIQHAFNTAAERVAIIEHPDVQRMLLEMKSKVEGSRYLISKLSSFVTEALILRQNDGRSAEAERLEGMAGMLQPVVKAYVSDQAWRICELAIQVHGGNGYLRTYPVEQYARDVKVLSIWEGTNYAQSLDLIRDKLGYGRNSKLTGYLLDEINRVLASAAERSVFAVECQRLRDALDAYTETVQTLAAFASRNRLSGVAGHATRFLEMTAELVLAWLLLEAALVAESRFRTGDVSADEAAFYRGKVEAARFFVLNVLPGLFSKAEIIQANPFEYHCDPALFTAGTS